MHHVIIALGSSYQQAAHLHWASQRLTVLLDGSHFSRLLWTQDVHGADIWYLNRLVTGYTPLSDEALQQALKRIESESQRTKARVTIDLDLMQYDSQRYHAHDWPRPYIQQLINDIL